MWSAEYQNEYLEMTHAVFDHYDFVQGELVWNFADFQTTEGILRVDGNKKGIFTRQPSAQGCGVSLPRAVDNAAGRFQEAKKMIPENSSALPVYPGRALLV